MSNKNIEMMKKLIEEKKQKGAANGGGLRPEKAIGSFRKGSRGNRKTGGVMDKG